LIRHLKLNCWKRVPGLLPGTLFLLCAAAAAEPPGDPSIELARSLFAEERWQECRTEAARRLAAAPRDAEAIYLKAAAERRCGIDSTKALRAVHEDPAAPELLRQLAACELARAKWQAGDPAGALPLFREVFDAAAQRDIFLEAACSIALIFRDNPRLASGNAGLKLQVRTCYPLFTPELRASCDPRAPRAGRAARLVGSLIGLYQSQVSPAIGSRCSLTPSCSRYATEAVRRHGLLGLAVYADRGYREPAVVARRERIVRDGDSIKVADPLDDHDWWMRGMLR